MTIPSNEPNPAYLRLTNWLVFGLFSLIGLAIVLCVQLLVTSYILHSREAARQNQCFYNLSGQMSGVLAYCHLNNGQFPASVCSPPKAVESQENIFSWRVWAAELSTVPESVSAETNAATSDEKTTEESKMADLPTNNGLSDKTQWERKGYSRFFVCPDSFKDSIPESLTSYMYVVGPDCISDGAESVKTDQLERGASYVLTVTEVIHSKTIWYKPGDLSQARYNQGSNLDSTELGAGSFHAPRTQRKVNIAYADGRAAALRSDIDAEIWRLLPIIRTPEENK